MEMRNDVTLKACNSVDMSESTGAHLPTSLSGGLHNLKFRKKVAVDSEASNATRG